MKIVNYKIKETGHLDKDYPQKAFNQLMAFQGYGFNKSHSVSYSYYAAIQLYLKKHYLIEFMCGILDEVDRSTQSKGVKLLEQRVRYCYNNGIKVNGPLVNKAEQHWVIKNNELYASISNIKGLGEKQAQIIKNNRPYTNITQFLQKTKFGKSKFETLLFAGAFDEFCDRETLYNWYYNVYTKKTPKKEEIDQMVLDFLMPQEEQTIDITRSFSTKELKELFYEYNGFNLQQMILNKYKNFLEENKKIKTIQEVLKKKVKFPMMIGKIQESYSFTSKNGKCWTKIKITDGIFEAEVMMSTSIYEGLKGKTLKEGNIVVLPVAVSETEMLFLGNIDKYEIKVLEQN